MRKFTKQLLTGVVALGMLAPVATSSLNPIKTTVNAKRHHRRSHRWHRRSAWHRGTPRMAKGRWYSHRLFRGDASWSKDNLKVTNSRVYEYAGFSDTKHGHFINRDSSGNVSELTSYSRLRYKKIRHGYMIRGYEVGGIHPTIKVYRHKVIVHDPAGMYKSETFYRHY